MKDRPESRLRLDRDDPLFDRLTREGPLPTLIYIQRLHKMGIGVYSHQEPYLNPELPFYESILALIADIARMEKVRRSERTKAGLRRVAAQGKKLGRPKGSKDSQKRVVRRRSYNGVSIPLG